MRHLTDYQKIPWASCILSLVLLCCATFNLQAQDQCAPVGWATQNGGTTGGSGDDNPETVTSASELQSALNSSNPEIIYLEGTIGSGVNTRIDVSTDNKTIFGRQGAKLVGGFDIDDAHNIIVRNLTIEGPGAEDVDGVDCITLENSTNVWLDHLDIYDGQDGNLDITNQSNYVSVTWCKFHYTSASSGHQYCMLIGNSEDKTSDRGHLKTTLQYNWFAEGVVERMPRVRYGQVHVVNNLYTSDVTNYAVRAGIEADILVESNVFNGTEDPYDLHNNNFTAIEPRNNIYNNVSGNTNGSGNAFDPPYSLNITPANQVESVVNGNAGATLSGTDCSNNNNEAPSVSLTAPSNGATFTQGDNVTLEADASDADGSVSSVSFLRNGNVLGTDNSAPYSYTISNAATGTHDLQAQATDDNGAIASSATVTVTVQLSEDAMAYEAEDACSYAGPVETEHSGYNGNGYVNTENTSGASIEWVVNADAAGSHNLNFRYANGSGNDRHATLTVNGNTEASQQSFAGTGAWSSWNSSSATVNLDQGRNTITLEANTSGGLANLDQLTISNGSTQAGSCTEPPNEAPSVTITAPSDGATFTEGDDITLEANASDADGSVTEVAFLRDGNQLTADNSSPYSYTINSAAAGTYTLEAVATDNEGASTTSSSVTITVEAPNQTPSVSLTAPSDGATFTEGDDITLEASASDADGSIAEVTFMRNGNQLTADNSAPYSYTISGADAGSYTLEAVATDNDGASATSSAVSIVVETSVNGVSYEAEDACSYDGPVETEHGGYNGNGYVNTENTSGASIEWVVNADAAGSHHLNFRYANGSGNDRHAALNINGNTVVSGQGFAATGAWTSWSSSSATVNLDQGRNTITLEANTSAGLPNLDQVTISNGSTQAGNCSESPNEAPSVSLTSPSDGAIFTEGDDITLEATASDADGSVAEVTFLRDGNQLTTDNNIPYGYTISSAAAGSYTLEAVATDNEGASTTSSSVSITVEASDNEGPVLGPSCLEQDARGTLELAAQYRENATSYSWWANGYIGNVSQQSEGYRANVASGPYFGGTTICVGVQYSTAPWYEKYCITIDPCSGAAKQQTTTAIQKQESTRSATVAPNPSSDVFTLKATKAVKQMKVVDLSGRKVESYEALNAGTNRRFGASLQPGIYQLILVYQNGEKEVLKLRKY